MDSALLDYTNCCKIHPFIGNGEFLGQKALNFDEIYLEKETFFVKH